MGERPEGNGSDHGYIDDVLRAAFRDESEVGESALEEIERSTGAISRVLLRDPPDDATPVVRVLSSGGPDSVRGDRRYQVQGEIARGGVGVVFKGRDRDLGRLRDIVIEAHEKRDKQQTSVEIEVAARALIKEAQRDELPQFVADHYW